MAMRITSGGLSQIGTKLVLQSSVLLFLAGCGEPMTVMDSVSNGANTPGASTSSPPETDSPPVTPPSNQPVTSIPTRGTGGSKGNSTGTCTVGGVNRAYALHVPNSYDPLKPSSIVVAMHGLGDNYQNFNNTAQVVGWHTLSEQRGFIFMVPAPVNSSRQSFLSFSANGAADIAAIQTQMNSLMDCVVNDVGRQFNIETLKIDWLGFSEGASFVGVAASYLSHRIRGVALYAGSAPRFASNVRRPIPLFYVVGSADYSYNAIVQQSETWISHPLNRRWVVEGHSFSGLNTLVRPAEVYDWLASQAPLPAVTN